MIFRRSRKVVPVIDMAPLLDVVFLLLVFFMLTSSFTPPSLSLALPKARAAEVAPPAAVVVSLDREGVISIGGEDVEAGDFAARLHAALAEASSDVVHFRGDEAVNYGRFLQLMALARQAGARQFHLIHSPAEGAAGGP